VLWEFPMKARQLASVAALVLTLSPAFAQPAPGIKLSQQQQERLGVKVETVEKAESVGIVELVGRVSRAPNGVSPVLAPFAGAVTKVHTAPGASLKVGDPIVSIASRDFATASSLLKQAESEGSAAEAALARQRQLVDLGLTPRSTLEEAEVRASPARALVQENRAMTAGTAGEGERGDGYTVRATASGRLSQLDVRVGDTVDAMAPLGSLTTSKSLWIEFQTPARLVGQVAPGDIVTLPGGASTSIISVTDVIDPSTRSATAITAAPADFIAFEGQLVRARLSRATQAADLVKTPSRAVVKIDGIDHVFRRTSDGFAPIPVNVVGRAVEAATIAGGLQPGDAVAVSGLTELKALAAQGGE